MRTAGAVDTIGSEAALDDVTAPVSRYHCPRCLCRERVARLRSEPTRLEQARRRRADFSSDVGKFEELIASLSAAVSREASRAEARAGDAEEQGRRLGELREENAALEKRVATQARGGGVTGGG